MSEAALLAWADQHAPTLACGLAYCVTADDMRKLLNRETGLSIPATEDRQTAFARFLEALMASRAPRVTPPAEWPAKEAANRRSAPDASNRHLLG